MSIFKRRACVDFQRCATADYTRAIELFPKYAKAYFNRGVTRALIGQELEAQKDLNKAAELQPDWKEKAKEVSRKYGLDAL